MARNPSSGPERNVGQTLRRQGQDRETKERAKRSGPAFSCVRTSSLVLVDGVSDVTDRETNEPRHYVNLRWLGGQQGFFVDADQYEACEKDMIVVVTGSIKTKIVEASAGTFCDLKFKINELEEAAIRETGPGPATVKDVA